MSQLNIKKIRQNYPALNQTINGKKPIYFDGPGGAQVPVCVTDAMVHYLHYANSNLLNSPFFSVQRTHETLAKARQNAADFVNATSPNEIIFGGSMTALTAHLSRSISHEWQAGDEIIVSELDHYSNVSFWQMAARDRGVVCHIAPINLSNGTLDTQKLLNLINTKTKFIAFTLASNLTGSRTDAATLIAAAKAVNAHVYVDAVHAAPHFLPDVQALDCDYLACSAYKFSGPHLGFVYGKSEHLNRLTPYKVEPASQQPPESWEMGTKSFEALAGFNAIIAFMQSFSTKATEGRAALSEFYTQLRAHETALTEQFLHLSSQTPSLTLYGITNPARMDERSPTFAFTLKQKDSLAISNHLAENLISTGSGNFYAKGVIDAYQLADSGGVVRAGCLLYTTADEIDALFACLKML